MELCRAVRGALLLLLTSLIIPLSAPAAETFISIGDFGAVGNGTTDDAPSLLAAVTAHPGATIRFPAADYLLNNSDGPITLTNFSGVLSFDPHARLVCLSPARGCLKLTGGSGARILNIRISYQQQPTQRGSEPALHLFRTIDTIVDGAVIESSPSAAIYSEEAIRPMVSHAIVRSSLADGIHFANCQDAKVSDAVTNNTGDDGLAFLNYVAEDDNRGGQANNVTVRNSHTRGISVVGQSDVTISNFLVDTTSSSGILCAVDPVFGTRTPDHVRFLNGIVRSAGTMRPTVGNTYGIEFSGATSCEFTDISVYASGSRSVAGSNPGGEVRLNNISTFGGETGIDIGITQLAILTNITAEQSTGYGVFIGTGGTAIADNIRTVNVATSNNLNRAVWFENNRDFRAHGITVIDTQAVPTGYIVGEASNSTGVATGIQSVIPNGALVLQYDSANVLLATENPRAKLLRQPR